MDDFFKKTERDNLIHLCLFMAIIVAMMAFIGSASAENNTTNATNITYYAIADTAYDNSYDTGSASDTLQDLSQQAKSFLEQVKATVPYEFWFFSSIALFILLMFVKSGNMAYGSIWKMGIYFAIIVAALWLVLTR